MLTISLILLIVFVIFPVLAHATTTSPVKLELEADPGTTLRSSIKVTNDTQNTETLYTTTLNFEPKGDESGEPNFISTKDGLAAWVKTEDSITLGPKEQKVLPFTIQIPSGTEPGGYFGALFTSTTPPKENDGGNVLLTERVGTLILLRVNGNLADSGDILEFGTKDKKFWYTALPIGFYFRFQNSGLDRVHPLGDVLIKNTLGRTTKTIEANPEGGNVLPKSIRRFELAWQSGSSPSNDTLPKEGFWKKVNYELTHFALGRYTVHLNLAYGTGALRSASSTTSVFVFPWHLVLVATLGTIILFLLLHFLLRHYNRWIIKNSTKKTK
jgi:hypothetical protein